MQDGLKLNGTYQLLVYFDGVNVLGRHMHTIKKNTDVLIVAGKESGLEVNTVKTEYIVMSKIRMIIVPLKGWNSSNIRAQPPQTKVLFRKKLRADRSQGIHTVIWCRILCLPFFYLEV